MKKYLLDTNSIIYAFNLGLQFPKYEYCISVISEIELLSYKMLTDEDEENLKNALRCFQSISLTDNIKTKTIEIRKSSNLKLPDCIIIASALIENAVLVTSDKQLLKYEEVEAIELKDLS